MQGFFSEQSDKLQSLSIGPGEALRYAREGVSLALSPQCRSFVLIPILINLLVYGIGGVFLYIYLQDLVNSLTAMWPQFLQILARIIAFLITVTLFCLSFYLFSTIACLIASPFYGMLAEKAEAACSAGETPNQTVSGSSSAIIGFLREIPACLWRECKKMLHMLPWLMLCLLVSIIPVINAIAPLLWFWFVSWTAALQYCDFAYDNHHIPFRMTRRDLRMNPACSFCLGALITLGLMIPIVNLVVPAAAVCAGTRYFCEIRQNFAAEKDI